jgi:beta-glucosidase/6-phospho-beta-glucosidase/beta-galactosidase
MVLLILQLENMIDILKYLEKNIQDDIRINYSPFHLSPLVRAIISSVVILTLAIPLNFLNL